MTLRTFLPMADNMVIDFRAVAIACMLIASMVFYPKLRKKKLSPILLIVLSAILGILVY